MPIPARQKRFALAERRGYGHPHQSVISTARFQSRPIHASRGLAGSWLWVNQVHRRAFDQRFAKGRIPRPSAICQGAACRRLPVPPPSPSCASRPLDQPRARIARLSLDFGCDRHIDQMRSVSRV